MDHVKNEAVGKLRKMMPVLVGFGEELEKIEERLAVVHYYSRFKKHKDTPRIIPIEELSNFYKFAIDLKPRMIEFKKSFNENNLSDEVRELFTVIYSRIVLIQATDANLVQIGGSTTWLKPLSYVLAKWESMDYEYRVQYSTDAFKTLKNFLALIGQIKKLDELVEG